jgi:protein-S-isoprenylcysteine O-methyltransferase Ste14
MENFVFYDKVVETFSWSRNRATFVMTRKSIKIVEIHVQDMDVLLSRIETAAWFLKGAILVVFVIGVFVLGIKYPDPSLWVMLGIVAFLTGGFVTLWVVWAVIRHHYGYWCSKSLAKRSLESLED